MDPDQGSAGNVLLSTQVLLPELVCCKHTASYLLLCLLFPIYASVMHSNDIHIQFNLNLVNMPAGVCGCRM